MTKHFLSFFLLICLLSGSLSAKSDIDSLWTVWQDQTETEKVRMKAMYKIVVNSLSSKPPDSILHLADILLEFAKEKGNKKYIANASTMRGIAFSRKKQYQAAISAYTTSLKMGKELDEPNRIGIALMNMASIYRDMQEYEQAMDYYQQALAINKETGDQTNRARLFTNIGLWYDVQNDTQNAIKYALEAAKAYQSIKDSLWMGRCYNQVGKYFLDLSDHESSIQYLLQALKIFENLKNHREVGKCLENIGIVYAEQEDDSTALSYYSRSLHIAEEIGNDKSAAISHSNIGTIYFSFKKFDQAEAHFQQALSISQEIGHDRILASSMSNLGNVLYKKGNYQEALKLLTQSIRLKKENGREQSIPNSLIIMGDIYYEQGQYEKAHSLYEEGFELAKSLNRISLLHLSYQSLFKSYKSLGQYQKALQMHELLIQAEDSIESIDNQRAVLRQEYKYEYEKQALADSLAFIHQQAQLKLEHQQDISRRNYWLLAGLLLGIAFFLFFRYRQQIRLQQEQAEQKRLTELDAVKSRLYTNITHEFRTPLTVIQGMARKVIEKPDKWLQQGTGMIERNSVQLLKLVNQMLDLSKLESGKLQLQAVQADIIPFLYYIAEPFQAMAESKEISLQIQQDVDKLTMDFDPDRMTEIISNLLSNAIKFTSAGGQIDIQALSDKEAFMLIVRDTGIGIPADKLPYVFDRFYQVDDSPTRSNEGTGIGLALSKELVHLMGGRVQVSSQIGEGTEFTITLPISQQAIVAELPLMELEKVESASSLLPAIFPEDNQLPSDLPHILLIEDNADVVSYLSSCLEANYRLSIARNGQEGIDKALELVPDLIISDVMMPEKDGFEVCHTLKQDIRTSHVPIIMLTAKADVDSKLTGLRRGADAYLSKPFHEEELLIRIHNLLEVRTTLQARYRSGSENLDLAPTAEIEKEDAFIQEVRQVVMSQLNNYQLDVPTLCKELGMARTPLHNKLKALTGMSTTEFVRYVRLTHAQELLRETDMHVSEIAYATGFQNHTYFSRKFKELFGQTPKEWREET
ncbi:MAG: tetratricopeptide repeat protein [Bacteroidota bacterium]